MLKEVKKYAMHEMRNFRKQYLEYVFYYDDKALNGHDKKIIIKAYLNYKLNKENFKKSKKKLRYFVGSLFNVSERTVRRILTEYDVDIEL